MRHFAARVALGGVSVCGLFVGLVGAGGPSLAEVGCSHYSALAATSGLRTVQSMPGLVLTDVDAALPAAQAQADSLRGSKGWAGIPYSSTVAENMQVTGANANEVPVFAVSSYPTQPEARKSTPAATIEAKSAPQSSTARAVGGGPASDQASAGRVSTSAAVSACEEDTTVRAVSENKLEILDIRGVLRIGSVRSYAQAVVDPEGEWRPLATMEVEGATVLGQRVAITDRGLVVGESTTPVPDNPAAGALAELGISLRYIAAVKDEERGEVFAPGLEVVVTRGVQGVGTGPISSSYTLGRAYARALASVDGLTAEVSPSGEIPALSGQQSQEATPSGPLGQPSEPAPAAPAESGSGQRVELPTFSIANASVAGVYAASAAGALLLLGTWLMFARLGVGIRWR